MRKPSSVNFIIYFLLFISIIQPPTIQAQVNYTANNTIRPYSGGFRAGVNFDIYRGFSDEDLALLAAGSDQQGISGVAAKAIRPAFFENFAELYGYDSRLAAFKLYDSIGLKDNTLIVGFPSTDHQDSTFYCPDHQSTVFKNLYAPIWDNGENGTPINDSNYYALYIWKTAKRYHNFVKFFEVWNEPGFDYTGGKGWLNRGAPGNWWENNPDPCDYKLRAPIFNYIRMLRITYEIVKSIDPSCYVMTSGLGYQSFLDAILRNTDNPNNGRVSPQYPLGGGAYFDGIGFHSYPHFDDALRKWNDTKQTWEYMRHSDAAAIDPQRIKTQFDAVLKNYGYNGVTYPKKTYIITESNIPRKEFGDFIGSPEAQKNWIPKVLVNCIKNDIWQLHIFKIAEETDSTTATYEFDLMGLYKTIHYSNKTRPDMTGEGLAFKTSSQILFGKVFDSLRTRQMNLPTNIDGAALKDSNGIYTYALWAKTSIDKNETASATYSFPTSFGYDILIKRNLDFAATKKTENISPQNILLSATPFFLTERKILLSQQFICEGTSVSFQDLSASATRTWTVQTAPNQTVTETAKTFTKTFSQRGNYTTQLIAKDANGTEIARQTLVISVEKAPTANFSCEIQNPNALLKNLSTTNSDSLKWTFSDGTQSYLPDLTKLFYITGNYNINLTVSNRCGSNTSTKNIRIIAPNISTIKTANDTTPQYNGAFRTGVNMRYVSGWTDEQIADIAAGNREEANLGLPAGIGAKSLRTSLPEYFTTFWGPDVRKNTFQHFKNLDLTDIIMTLGYPDSTHRDPNYYCYSERSSFFKNMYTNIFDGGTNGTTVNDTNYFARYVYDMVKQYKGEVKFWEIWDTPGWDIEGKNGWKPNNWQHNWWQNNPDPCELGTKAPIQHFVRMLRIAYEVIKKEDPSAYIVYSGSGFASFLDAVCRNTDNPSDGSATSQYPFGGGAYFDAVLYNVFPHFDGTLSGYDPSVGGIVNRRNSDVATSSITRQRDSLQAVLSNYGYNGSRFPKKKFLIGEINVPRKPLGTLSFGSDEIQKNFIMKSYVTAATNGILQMNVKSISDETSYNDATDGSQVMGLYQKLPATPYIRAVNVEGVAFKTISEILFGLVYDSVRTRLLGLSPDMRGAAFKNSANKYTYVLWAKTQSDMSEWAFANYSFPKSLNINQLYRREWSYSNDKKSTTLSSQGMTINGTPVFFSEDSLLSQPPIAAFGSDNHKACPALTVKFSDNSANASSYQWRFDGGTPALSTDKNPIVTYTKSGKYDVVLEVRNAQGIHENRKLEYVEVLSAPKANFSWTRDSNNLTVRFTNLVTNSYTLSWDFGDGSTDLTLNPSHLFTSRKIYTVRLIAANDCGRDTIFKTIDLRVNDVKETQQTADFQCFPNPFDDILSVQFYLSEESSIDFGLYDVSGRLVKQLAQNVQYTEGVNRQTFSASNLAAGVYFLKLKTDKQILYKQVMKF